MSPLVGCRGKRNRSGTMIKGDSSRCLRGLCYPPMLRYRLCRTHSPPRFASVPISLPASESVLMASDALPNASAFSNVMVFARQPMSEPLSEESRASVAPCFFQSSPIAILAAIVALNLVGSGH